MRLLIVRHGAAVERGTAGIPDDERPLTEAGEKKFRQAARGLAREMEKPYAILTSPLPRAHRTAEILGEAYSGITLLATPALAGGSFDDLFALLKDYPQKSTVAVVGHEPYLSSLLARLIGAREGGGVPFKKGGMALVELEGGLKQGGQLLFFMPPRLLRTLG